MTCAYCDIRLKLEMAIYIAICIVYQMKVYDEWNWNIIMNTFYIHVHDSQE
jgi:hypothetical protein